MRPGRRRDYATYAEEHDAVARAVRAVLVAGRQARARQVLDGKGLQDVHMNNGMVESPLSL